MTRPWQRHLAFFVAGTVSFCSTIAPAQAAGSYTGLATINSIIRGTIGSASSVAGGVSIARTAGVVISGVTIPFTLATRATFAEVAIGGVAAAIGSPLGLAAGVVIAAAVFYGWNKCVNSPSGWCKQEQGQYSNITWNVAGGQYSGTDKTATELKMCNQLIGADTNPVITNEQLSPDGYGGYAGQFDCEGVSPYAPYNTVKYPGVSITGRAVGEPTTTNNPKTYDPIHDPEAKSFTQRAMEENKITATALADAAQADGHPIDDPAVNPNLPTTVTSPTAATPPTSKLETAPDGTTTRIDCTGTSTIGKSSGDNTTATLTSAGGTSCITTVTAPNGTVTTSKTDTTSAPVQEPPAGAVECGSPGKPKCAIDETGTPTSIDLSPATTALTKTTTDAQTGITGAADSSTKDTGWKFSFNFPSSCSSITLFQGVVVDFCSFKPMVHDLMSMIWVASASFCIIGMVGRTVRGSA